MTSQGVTPAENSVLSSHESKLFCFESLLPSSLRPESHACITFCEFIMHKVFSFQTKSFEKK